MPMKAVGLGKIFGLRDDWLCVGGASILGLCPKAATLRALGLMA